MSQSKCKRCTEECPFGALDEDEKGNPMPNVSHRRRRPRPLRSHRIHSNRHPLSVQALALPNSGRYQDDNAAIQIALADGSFGTIQYLANGDRSCMKERIEVFSGGRIAILSDFRELDTWNAGETKKTKSAFRIDKGHSHSWKAFVDAVANGGQAPIPLDEIFAASLASFAAVESIRQKDGIQVPAVESLSEISLNGVE